MKIVVIFDLEFTAWPGSMAHRWSRPGEFREVVQIGAVKADAATFEPVDAFVALVKPRLNPLLSSYFEELTGITNAQVASKGLDLVDAYRAFMDFAAGAPLVAFGRDDLVLEDNMKLYGRSDMPAMRGFVNIRPWFVEQGIETRGLHSCDIASAVGASFVGRRHDALDDSRSIALAIATLLARGACNPLIGEG